MKINLVIWGSLKELLPHLQKEYTDYQVLEGTSIENITKQLEIPDGLVLNASVDGVLQDLDYIPFDGQRVVLLSPIAGG